jgi:hypothetical protein
VPDLKDGFALLIKKKYGTDIPSMITNVTGPSRTADIEKTLVLGAHGPKELFVFLLGGINSTPTVTNYLSSILPFNRTITLSMCRKIIYLIYTIGCIDY